MRSKFKYWLIIFILIYWCSASIVGHTYHYSYMWSDEEGYYIYLPAIFINGGFENMPVRTKYEYKPFPGTNKVATRFTYGVAFLELPFFLIARAYQFLFMNSKDDPYAEVYSISILTAACFYLTLGFYFLYNVLISCYKDTKLAVSTLIILFFGTNILYYTSRQAGMSHIYTFFLVCALLYYLRDFYEKNILINYINIGFILSLIILIRPTNVIFILLVFFYNVQSTIDLKERIKKVLNNSKKLAFIPLIGLLIALPQVYYWHYISGKWIINIYSEIFDQHFNWRQPHMFQIFFSLCNGFLVYNPIMLFGVIGIVMLSLKNELNGRLIFSIFLIIAYILSCWALWWFGGAYGYRSFIDFYPLLAFGIAYYLQKIFKIKYRWFFYANIIIVTIFVFVNIRMVSYFYNFQVEPNGENSTFFWDALSRCFWLN